METNESKAGNFATLMGGSEVVVVKADGTDELVKVKQLAIKLFPKLLACGPNELAKVELYCDRPEGWSETLTPKSHEEIILEGDKLNADFFGRWRTRTEAAKALLPKENMGDIVQMIEVLQKTNPALMDDLLKKATATLPNSAPKPPSSVASPASK